MSPPPTPSPEILAKMEQLWIEDGRPPGGIEFSTVKIPGSPYYNRLLGRAMGDPIAIKDHALDEALWAIRMITTEKEVYNLQEDEVMYDHLVRVDKVVNDALYNLTKSG